MSLRFTNYCLRFSRLSMLLLALWWVPAWGQSAVRMVNGDTVRIDGCAYATGVIYDDGGVSNQYSNNFNGWVVIESDSGSTFTLGGQYNTEGGCDRIDVWIDDSLIVNDVSGEGTLNVTATGSRITFYFHTDGSVVRDGFEITWSVSGWGANCSAQVSGLTASNITANSATLNWNSTETGTFHIVLDDYPVGTTTSTTYTLTNLTASSHHSVRVYYDGQESQPCCSDITSFRTLCGDVALPLEERFDDFSEDDIMPACWIRSFNFDDEDAEPQLVNLANFGTDNSLMVSCGTNSEASHFGMIISPVLLDRGTWRVRMRLRTSHAGTVALLGTCDTTSDEYASFGFNAISTYTFNDNNQWYDYEEIWTIPSDGYRLAVRMVQSDQNGTGRRVYIDDVRIEACGILSISTSHVESDEMTLSWTTLGTPSVTVGVRERGAIADAQTITNATSPLHITGLTPQTNYVITLYPVCGGINGQTESINVRTQSTGVVGDRFCLGFYGVNNVPEELTIINLTNVYVSGNTLAASTYNGAGYIVSERLSSLAGKEIAVRTHSYYSSMVIGTMTYADDPTTFTPLDSTGGGWYWDQYLYAQVPATNTDHYVALKVKDCYINLYSITVSNCELDSLRVTHARGTSITLQWAPLPTGNDSVRVEYGPEGFTMGTGLTAETRGNSIEISGLTPERTYEFIVYRPCGGEPCGNVRLRARTITRDYPMPYCEDFEYLSGTNRWNTDWQRWNGIGSCPQIDYSHRWDGAEALELAAYENSRCTVVLPDIAYEDSSILSFWAYSSAPLSYIELKHAESHRDESNYWDPIFTPFDTIELSNLSGWHHYAVPLPDSVQFRVALRYFLPMNQSLYRVWIDDLSVSKAAFGNANFYDVTPTSVHIAAEAMGNADSLRLMLIGGGDTLYQTLTSDSTLITGLDTATYYEGYLLPMSADAACWNYIGYFITPAYGSGAGWNNCNTFEDVLSDELPNGWWFNNTNENVWNMQTTSLGTSLAGHTSWLMPKVATAMPYLENGDGNLTFAARGLGIGSYLLVGAPTQITLNFPNIISSYTFGITPDTLWLDTAEWSYFTIPLSDFGEWGHYILFEVGGNGGAMLSEIGVTHCPIVHFGFTGGSLVCSTDSTYHAEYMLYLTDGDTTRTFHVTENPFVINDITFGTTYKVSWECPYQNSGCLPTCILHTPDLLPLPYCNHFDADGDNMPTSWTFVENEHGSYVRYDYSNTSLYFQSYGDHWQYAILPPMEVDSSLSIKLRIHSSREGTFELGYLANPSDTGTFVTIAKNPQLWWNWWTMEADLYNYRDKRLALRNRDFVYVDYIYLVNQPLAHYSHIDARTVKVWTEHGGDYWLHYRSNNTECNYGEGTIHVTDSVIFFRDTCHHWNSWAELFFRQMPDSNNTACDEEHQCRLTYHYDIPYCYDIETAYAGYGRGTWGLNVWMWQQQNKRGHSDPVFYSDEDKKAFRMNCHENQFILLPELTIDSIRNASLVLEYLSTSANSRIEVGVLTDAYDTNTFVPIDTIEFYDAEEWNTVHINFNAYTDTGRWIGLHTIEHPDGNMFYIKELRAENCHSALGATASLYRHNVVKIDNPLPTADDDFFVEYGLHNFTQGTGTIMRIHERPVYLTLQNETDYDFYFRCDSASTACSPVQVVTTLCAPISMPACIDFDTNALNLPPHCWATRSADIMVDNTQAHSGTQSLRFTTTRKRPLLSTSDVDIDSLQKVSVSLWVYTENQGDRLIVGTMADPHDNATFHPIRTLIPAHAGQWERFMVDFSAAAEDAHFIGLRAAGSVTTGHVYVDDIFVSDCGAHGLRAVAVAGDSITLDWSQVGSPDITITMVDNGVPTQTFSSITEHPFTVYGLTPKHRYTFLFNSTCSYAGLYCNSNYEDSTSLVTPSEGVGCINPTDLSSAQAVFYSGTFGNPYSTQGAIDYGSNSPDSRHTVHYDTAEFDPRTGGLLRTVPEGFSSSVRLGNWNTNESRPEAEGVIYSLMVDTLNFDMLVMRYAAVLQNPMHASADQPRFRLELLDSNFVLIDPVCAVADFIANRFLGWNEAANDVLWKDWTAVGIDLSDYAGQQVYVRLTTYDCNEGSHYGYAYFNLECMRKDIASETCGDVDSNHFTAPTGFSYRWHTERSNTTIGTSQTLTVPTATQETYLCELSFVGNSACKFTLKAYGGARYALALLDTNVTAHDCQFDVQFINRSTISADGVTPVGTGESCIWAQWDFGNGETSSNYHAKTTYPHTGTYYVTLIVGIAGGCTDTLVWPLELRDPSIAGPSHVCMGQSATLTIMDGTTTDPRWTANTYTVTTTAADTALPIVTKVTVTGLNGCDTLIQHTLYVDPPTTTYDTVQMCEADFPLTWNDTLLTLSSYSLPLTDTVEFDHRAFIHSVYGCDSTTLTHFIVVPVPTLTHSNDTTVISGATVHLHASGTDIISWRNADGSLIANTPNADVNPMETTTYYIEGFSYEGDVAFNGDFEAGNTGFTSQYTQSTNLVPEGTYAVGTRAADYHPDFCFAGDHTSGNGNYLVVNGSRQAGTTVWTQTVEVHPYTTYMFSAWAMSVAEREYDSTQLAQLQFSINGSQLGDIFYTPMESCRWTQFYQLWNSGPSASATISILNQNTNLDGNDFGLDDITLSRLTACVTHDSLTVTTLCGHEYDSATCSNYIPFTWNGITVDSIGTYQLLMTSPGCGDSVVIMHLSIPNTSTTYIRDTVLQNNIPSYTPPVDVTVSYTDNPDDPALVTIVDTTFVFSNIEGCDSTVIYRLQVYRNFVLTDTVIACDNQLPYLWEGFSFSADTILTSTLTSSHGSDSTVTLVFLVKPTYDVNDTVIICPYRPFLYEEVDYGGPIDFDSPHLSLYKCDSLVHVSLRPRDSAFRLEPVLSLDGSPWMPYDTLLLDCDPANLQFLDSISFVAYNWSFWNVDNISDTATGSDSLFSTLVDSVGIYSFQLITFSHDGCYDTVRNDSLLWVYASPEAGFYWDPDHLSIHNPEIRFYNSSTPADSLTYLWLIPLDPGASSYDTSYEVNPSYSWEINADTGDYPVALIAYFLHQGPDTLTITCTDTATIPISIVNTYLQFPNSVTPNGDGINDRWVIVNLLEMGEYSMNELWIYDRWGALVYHVKNISNSSDFWDPLDTHSPDGTYYYRFSAKNNFGVIKRNGIIEVTR